MPGHSGVPGFPAGLGNPCELLDIMNHLDHLEQIIAKVMSICSISKKVTNIPLPCTSYSNWFIIDMWFRFCKVSGYGSGS